MSEPKSNSGLLAVIAVVLVALLGIAVYEMNKDTPAEQISEGLNDVADSVQDAAN